MLLESVIYAIRQVQWPNADGTLGEAWLTLVANIKHKRSKVHKALDAIQSWVGSLPDHAPISAEDIEGVANGFRLQWTCDVYSNLVAYTIGDRENYIKVWISTY